LQKVKFIPGKLQGNKLVDENKGLLAAIEYVRNLSGIESSYQVRHLPEEEAICKEL
jgi:hypothetical protein